ncbi:metallophosphoesterase family protein [Natronobacterium gregoryi]|uniref:Phosphoesterase n=2 Tax=Natronobacterium gregoryi TaxID=44930 RepID=L0AIR7_NATGS|nr:metallophosphoesterase family protein [Natronobacterium gregoryi]AFZ72960.1 putative phosphoesterase [Natronobacterium gregoryi SP2]ELY69892.1 phosphodiesterase, MJ0936 family protein [Natronobacterium gregoryi SP2]PLK21816.1 metallophosphoesterase [Natronobacterium gregoryi SP2]SFI68532.1 phosphoesterase, MJ0936 family [Natronobacterium gregoryi]
MKVGLISDVHSNRIALEAVLEDMPPVDELACAGDVVGYNPWPADCVDELRERGVATVMGNHDAAVATETPFRFNGIAQAGVEHAEGELSTEQLEWLADLPKERLECDGRLKIVHGHPDDPDRYSRYTYPEEFSPRMLDDEDVLVLGHTHVQGVEKFAEGIVLNPGSVGQPRDGDPRAGYAVIDLDAMTVETHRVEYDIETVQETVQEVGLPERIGRRLERGT